MGFNEQSDSAQYALAANSLSQKDPPAGSLALSTTLLWCHLFALGIQDTKRIFCAGRARDFQISIGSESTQNLWLWSARVFEQILKNCPGQRRIGRAKCGTAGCDFTRISTFSRTACCAVFILHTIFLSFLFLCGGRSSCSCFFFFPCSCACLGGCMRWASARVSSERGARGDKRKEKCHNCWRPGQELARCSTVSVLVSSCKCSSMVPDNQNLPSTQCSQKIRASWIMGSQQKTLKIIPLVIL